MKGNEYLKQQMQQHGITDWWLALEMGWNKSSNMVWQLKNNKRRITPEQAIKFDEVTGGKIRAEMSCPEFFSRLSRLGFYRKQGDCMEQPHGKEAKETNTVNGASNAPENA